MLGIKYLFTNGKVFFYFYVDDIVTIYYYNYKNAADGFIKGLLAKYAIYELSDLK